MHTRQVVFGVVACLVFASCSDNDEPSATTESSGETATIATTADEGSAATVAVETSTTVSRVADGPLADGCPATITVQLAGLPDPAMGPLFSLLGPNPEIDVETQTVTAPLVRPDGTVEDVMLELRSGGPAVGFRSPLSLLTADEGLLLAQVSTADALLGVEADPSLAIVTLTDRSRDAVIVDPATYPDVTTLDGVRDAGIEVRHRTAAPVFDYLVATGALVPEQLVNGFDGEPASFVQAGGTIAQQGDLLVETVLFPALPQWARPVTAIPASASGWAVYDDALVARPGDVDELATCLGRLVPIVQRSLVTYLDDPAATNQLMAALRSSFAPLSRLTAELMTAGIDEGRRFEVFSVDADQIAGSFDLERLDVFLPELAEALAVDTVAVDELVTDEFLDPDVTSAG